MKKTAVGIIAMALTISSQGAANFSTDMGTNAVTGVVAADLDNVSTGGHWGVLYNNINTTNIVGNAGGTDYGFLIDEGGAAGNSQWTSATLYLDEVTSFIGSSIEVQFDMAYTRSGSKKKLSMMGFGTGSAAGTVVFRYDWDLAGDSDLTASGAGETLIMSSDYDAFASATAAYDPGKMKTFNVTIDGTTLTYGAEGLASQSTTVLNAQTQLSSIRWAITGTGNGANQGFWLDNVNVTGGSEALEMLTASLGAGGDVELEWSAVTDATGYNIYRSTNSGGYGAALANESGTNYTDTAAALHETYYYQVAAVVGGVESALSPEVSIFTYDPADTTPPLAPASVTALVGGSRVTLDWDDSPESDFVSYTVYTSLTNGGPYSALASNLTTSVYRDNGLPVGFTNYYVVTATDYTGNESDDSLEVEGIPEAPTGDAKIYFVMSDGKVYGFDSLDADGEISIAGQKTIANGIPVVTNAAYGTYQSMMTAPNGAIVGVTAAGDVESWDDLSDWVAGTVPTTLSTGLVTIGMNGAGYNISSDGYYAVHNQAPYQGDIIEYPTLNDFVNGVIDTNLVTARTYNTIAMSSSYAGNDVNVEYFHVGGTGAIFGYASMATYKTATSSFVLPQVVGSGTEVAAGFALLQVRIGDIAITIDGSDAIVSWEGTANASYTLQSKGNLTIAGWADAGSVTSSVNDTVSITNSIGADQEFYQVVSP